ncbi:MAG: hypothetical protein IKH38_06110 [Clostridia bacterium]|nr:hypothetical protein [Clostridia bacterium]
MKKTRKWLTLTALLLIAALLFSSCAQQPAAKSADVPEEPAAPVVTDADRYAEAVRLFSAGQTADARAAFTALGSYEDAAAWVGYVDALALQQNGDYTGAQAAFAALGDFQDSAKRCFDSKLAGYETTYAAAKVALLEGSFDAAAEGFGKVAGYEDASRYQMYARAMKLAADGDYATAVQALRALGDFQDAALQATYYDGLAKEAGSDFAGADEVFGSIPVFRDSDDRRLSLADRRLDELFATAAADYNENGWSDALAMTFNSLLGMKYTTDEKLMFTKSYDLADQALTAGRVDDAEPLFALLNVNGMEEAAARLRDCSFQRALALVESGDYTGALAKLAALGDYPGVKEPMQKCYAKLADAAYAANDYAGAYDNYLLAGDFEGSAAKAQALVDAYTAAKALMSENKFDEAHDAFAALYNYADAAQLSNESLYRKAKALEDAGDYEGAIAQYQALGSYSDSALQASGGVYYRKAEAMMKTSSWEEASAAFTAAGAYLDAADRVTEPFYRQGNRLMADDDLEGALAAFIKADGYGSSATRIKEIYYEMGKRYVAAEDWAAAVEAFREAGDYEDAVDLLASAESKLPGAAPAATQTAEETPAEAPAAETTETAEEPPAADSEAAQDNEPAAEATALTTTANENK